MPGAEVIWPPHEPEDCTYDHPGPCDRPQSRSAEVIGVEDDLLPIPDSTQPGWSTGGPIGPAPGVLPAAQLGAASQQRDRVVGLASRIHGELLINHETPPSPAVRRAMADLARELGLDSVAPDPLPQVADRLLDLVGRLERYEARQQPALPTISDAGGHLTVSWPNGRPHVTLVSPEVVEGWVMTVNDARAEITRLRSELRGQADARKAPDESA